MKFIAILVFATLLIRCGDQKNIQKKRIGNKIIETNFIEDSIFDGPTRYYNLNGKLESLIHYSRGLKNGVSLNFYGNGRVHDSTIYLNGLENGWHYVYDSDGQLIFKDYFFYGQNIGAEVHYKKGKPFQFSFSNFERKKLFSCGYDSIGMVGFSGEVLNVSSYTVSVDSTKRQGIFVYLIYPPGISMKYTLGVINEKNNRKNELFELSPPGFFKDTTLPLPEEGWKYYVAGHYNDTANKYEKVFFNIIEN